MLQMKRPNSATQSTVLLRRQEPRAFRAGRAQHPGLLLSQENGSAHHHKKTQMGGNVVRLLRPSAKSPALSSDRTPLEHTAGTAQLGVT